MLPSASEEMLTAASASTPSGSSPLRRSVGVHDLQELMATRSVLLWEGLPEARVASAREEHRQQPTTVTQRAPYAASFEWCIPNFPAFLSSARSNAPSSPASVAASASAPPALPPAPSSTMLSSPTFVSHGQAWHLVAFPDGVSDSASGFLSVFLRRLPPPVGGNGEIHAPTGKVVVVSEPHPPSVPVTARSSGPAPIAPPPPSSALLSSGLLFVRPQFRLTLIHPSGDARCNLVIDSEGIDINFLHAAYPQQQPKQHPADSPPSTFGLARFLHHSVILHQFLDAHGNILLRVEMIELKRYVWSMPLANCVPPIPVHIYTALPQPLPRVPTLVPSITRAAQARNASFSSSTSSAFAATSSSSSSSSSSRGSRAGPVIRQPSSSSHSSHSSLSLHSLTSFFSPSRSSQPSAAQCNANALHLQQQQLNHLMQHCAYNTRSSVTSSHLMFHGYEFFLRLDSLHAVSPMIPAARLEDLACVLVLHPRHLYRLTPELSLRVEVELTVSPAQQVAPLQPSHDSAWLQRVPQRSTFLTQLHSGGRHAEICWSEAGMSLAKALKDVGAVDPFAPVSLASYSSLHVSADFLSLGLVWTVTGFSALSSARKVSGMFRLKDYTSEKTKTRRATGREIDEPCVCWLQRSLAFSHFFAPSFLWFCSVGTLSWILAAMASLAICPCTWLWTRRVPRSPATGWLLRQSSRSASSIPRTHRNISAEDSRTPCSLSIELVRQKYHMSLHESLSDHECSRLFALCVCFPSCVVSLGLHTVLRLDSALRRRLARSRQHTAGRSSDPERSLGASGGAPSRHQDWTGSANPSGADAA